MIEILSFLSFLRQLPLSICFIFYIVPANLALMELGKLSFGGTYHLRLSSELNMSQFRCTLPEATGLTQGNIQNHQLNTIVSFV